MPSTPVTSLLQRSLERHRLAHAYLFTGNSLAELENVALQLIKTLNCLAPPSSGPDTPPLQSCGHCDNCKRIATFNHPDVLWLRPESKSRIITIEQIRQLLQTINLKPLSAQYKVAVIVAADRLNTQAANAFLKTLEEPPPNSLLILLTTDPQRILETILSRCLRLTFGGNPAPSAEQYGPWLATFAQVAARSRHGLLDRYKLLAIILNKLSEQKTQIEKDLAERSPLEHYDTLDPRTRDKLEQELTAAIEAEYRRQRADLLGALHWWLRDIWLHTLNADAALLTFPSIHGAKEIAQRISTDCALSNLIALDCTLRQLNSNVQEPLSLEVALLKLHL